MRTYRRVFALACLVVAASCGGDDTATESPDDATTDEATAPTGSEPADEAGGSGEAPTAGAVCALASDEEISAIIGNDVVSTDLSPTLCEYSLAGGQVAVDGTTVDLTANDAFDDVCSLEFDVAGTSDATPVDDVGKLAKWDGGTQTSLLFVCTGTSFFIISQYTPSTVTDDQALAQATDIAHLVIDRR